jgi:hypothetical protein
MAIIEWLVGQGPSAPEESSGGDDPAVMSPHGPGSVSAPAVVSGVPFALVVVLCAGLCASMRLAFTGGTHIATFAFSVRPR